jgi:hypothetical protein
VFASWWRNTFYLGLGLGLDIILVADAMLETILEEKYDEKTS